MSTNVVALLPSPPMTPGGPIQFLPYSVYGPGTPPTTPRAGRTPSTRLPPPSPARARAGGASLVPQRVRNNGRLARWTATTSKRIERRLLFVDELRAGSLNVTFQEGASMFGCTEVMEMALYYTDWHTLMSVSRVSRQGRLLVRNIVYNIIKRILCPRFILKEEFDGFMKMLDINESGIIGSIARLLFHTNSLSELAAVDSLETRYLTCKDLNIAVARGRIDAVRNWFNDRSYGVFAYQPTQRVYSGSVRDVWVANRPSSDIREVSNAL